MSEENKVNNVEALIISGNGVISMRVEGKSYTVAQDHLHYKKILNKLKDKDYTNLLDLIDVSKGIAEVTDGVITVKDGNVQYKGREVVNPLTDRIVKFIQEGLPFEPMVKFLENLMQNPSRTSVQELYLFLENNELPITEDGHFVAYKKVRNDYKDIYSGEFDNSVGSVCEMLRNEVCDIRERTCSQGLHFCSKQYLPSFGSCQNNRVMLVKVNPADVVSIPSDYNNAKGRTWKYEVIGEVTDEYREFLEDTGTRDWSMFDTVERSVCYYDNEDDRPDHQDERGGVCKDCGDYEDELNADGLCYYCEDDNDPFGRDDDDYGDDPDGDDDGDDPEDIPPVPDVPAEGNTDSRIQNLKNRVGNLLGRKPDGQRYHNERGSDGKFKKRS
jgi:hypothetical protein